MSVTSKLGERIVFIRDKLGMQTKEVYLALDIPKTTYLNMESGSKTYQYDTILKLATFLNANWQRKYWKFKNYPEGIDQITPGWLLFGNDPVLDNAKALLAAVEADFRVREHEMQEVIRELREIVVSLRGRQ